MGNYGVDAIAFFATDGIEKSWNMAAAFAGNGRMASLPDIIDARIAAPGNTFPWGAWVTTRSAEYYGLYKNERPTLVVSHNVGPLSTIDGVLKSFDHEFEGKQERQGYITQEEFDNLVEGKYGEVHVVDWVDYCDRHKYYTYDDGVNFDNGTASRKHLLNDEYFLAQMGGLSRATKYLKHHERLSRSEAKVKSGLMKNDLSLSRREVREKYKETSAIFEHIDKNIQFSVRMVQTNTLYCDFDISSRNKWMLISPNMRLKDSGYAMAHLICLEQLHWTAMRTKGMADQLVTSISLNTGNDAARFVGVNHSEKMPASIAEFDFDTAVEGLYPEVFVPVEQVSSPINPVSCLIDAGEHLFTQVEKEGNRLDTGEPEYLVTASKDVGKEKRINVGENMFFLRYDIAEHVMKKKPKTANAYTVVSSDPRGSWISVQFHRIEVDQSRRLLRKGEFLAQPDLVMSAVRRQLAA